MTEQFDPPNARSPLVLKIIRATPRNQKAIDLTLNRLVAWASSPLGVYPLVHCTPLVEGSLVELPELVRPARR